MAERECVEDVSGSALISIITINYNQPDVTRQFLDSVKRLQYPNYEVIIIDNGSLKPLYDFIDTAEFPCLRLIRSETNLGFTGGNNLGMKEAKGDYFFIVNNDTELSPTLLDNLLTPFSENPEIGVVCPKIRFYDAPGIIQYAGYNPINMFTGTATSIGYNQVDKGQFDKPHTTNFAHGCAMLIRRTVVERVGRFAERFFLYYEELDWSQRIRNAGYLIYYQPSASILHKESVSVGQNSPLKTYYLTRNRILFIRRHGSSIQRLVFYLFFGLCIFPKHMASYILNGQLKHAKAFLNGTVWNFKSASFSPV